MENNFAVETDINLLSIDEVAEALQVSPETVRHWILKKKIPYFKIGRNVRFRRQELLNWMAAKLVDE